MVECYYLLGPEQAADSNMQMTLLTHTLDVVRDIMARRKRELPWHLAVHADNTCREQRNQFLMQWAASLSLKGLFRSISYTFLPVGHTHIGVDQRFSMIRAALCRQAVLETPEDGARKGVYNESTMLYSVATLPCTHTTTHTNNHTHTHAAKVSTHFGLHTTCKLILKECLIGKTSVHTDAAACHISY